MSFCSVADEVGASQQPESAKDRIVDSQATMEASQDEVMLRDSVGESALSSGTSQVVDAAQHIESARSTQSGGEATGRPGLKDLLKIVQVSSRFSEVTEEQLERVRTMHDRISSGAEFSFNYNTLLFVASLLAGLGLVGNSSATIIASMLVSPIMGPVVGIAYAATILDFKLLRKAILVELLSLLYCILVGALLASTTGPTALAQDWPTAEMVSRGDKQNFLLGIPIAFVSGLGVAVSLLDDQTSSLVGVAISASLLPPAVNAGILWVAYAFYKADSLAGGEYVRRPVPLIGALDDNTTASGLDEGDVQDIVVDTLTLIVNRLQIHYDGRDFFYMGGLSISLTLVNIVLIIMSSVLMFRMKEVGG